MLKGFEWHGQSFECILAARRLFPIFTGPGKGLEPEFSMRAHPQKTFRTVKRAKPYGFYIHVSLIIFQGKKVERK